LAFGLELKIGTPFTHTLGNFHSNFGFIVFCSC